MMANILNMSVKTPFGVSRFGLLYSFLFFSDFRLSFAYCYCEPCVAGKIVRNNNSLSYALPGYLLKHCVC